MVLCMLILDDDTIALAGRIVVLLIGFSRDTVPTWALAGARTGGKCTVPYSSHNDL